MKQVRNGGCHPGPLSPQYHSRDVKVPNPWRGQRSNKHDTQDAVVRQYASNALQIRLARTEQWLSGSPRFSIDTTSRLHFPLFGRIHQEAVSMASLYASFKSRHHRPTSTCALASDIYGYLRMCLIISEDAVINNNPALHQSQARTFTTLGQEQNNHFPVMIQEQPSDVARGFCRCFPVSATNEQSRRTADMFERYEASALRLHIGGRLIASAITIYKAFSKFYTLFDEQFGLECFCAAPVL
ncbi:predicted protein [Plenodomus lingam JN3]|uniref:Predicted protein n=2 Tax=Leptosphaeria maculans TaxID=5022 RepID=E5ABS6_LEPMJ|nr:predicted protein [Plenodomus lingam JN3]CBY01117.1 predicted protein [Plenodomus lingam JN3]